MLSLLRNKDEEAVFMRTGAIAAVAITVFLAVNYVFGAIGRYCDDICPKGWMEGDDEE